MMDNKKINIEHKAPQNVRESRVYLIKQVSYVQIFM